jgi:hypothetical protein
VSGGEEGFFEGGQPPAPPRPPRRESPLLVRSPVFAVLALAVSGWLLFDLASDVAYFMTPLEPLDLGGAGSYRLDLARENRLVQVRGELAEAVSVTVSRTGQERTVGRIAGTNLLVDRPGRGGPPIYEGRLVPARQRGEYAEAVGVLRARGAPLGEAWLVVRDGERPRTQWLQALGAFLLTLLVAVNLRALVKSFLD